MEDTILQIEKSLNSLNSIGGFLTSGNKIKANTMSISWGSIGYMWKKKIFSVVISDIRYTKEFIDKENTFTISIPYDRSFDKALDLCGHNSGRNINKEMLADLKFIPGKVVNSPVIDGCSAYYECRVLLKQKVDVNSINPELNLDEEENGYTMYFGEIVGQYFRN